ncbi:MAG: hypothetical protein H7X77_00780 [Anaerolineae bacterium]|nr:hypothetical protein [Anaerolineae bacterium]
MSNRNDFDFDDDPFGNDDDNFDSFDDDFDDGELDSFENLGGADDDDVFDDEEQTSGGGGGPNRAFIILAVLMILLFLGGLAAILLIATRDPGETDFERTSTAIAQINGTRIAFITETAVQNQVFIASTQTQDFVFIGQTQTAAALPTETPTVAATDTPTPTLTLEVTNTPEGGISQEDLAATFAAATETAVFGTNQAQATPISGPGTLSANDVLLTATALFLTLNPQTPGPGTNVAVVTLPPVTPNGFATPRPGQLPDTGLFDGFASGQGLGTVALLTFGLIGLIFVSRRLRK